MLPAAILNWSTQLGRLDREFLADWSQAFMRLVDDNAHELVGRNIDAERNAKLGELLAELNVQL